jgi:hypothetical protein
MKKIMFSILILVCNIVFSQTTIPGTYSKIKFVYEQKSNFLIQDDKLYGDTLLLKFEFPKLKFSKISSPPDSTKTIGFIHIKSLNNEDKKKLSGILYHSTHTIEGTYDVKKNKTTLFFTRGNKALSAIFKEHFEDTYRSFSYSVVVDYNKKKIHTNYPSVNYTESFDTQLKKINFLNDNKSLGTYTSNTKRGFENNVVTLNKKYSNKITPHIIFSNNDFVVDNIISLFDTITLMSATYE